MQIVTVNANQSGQRLDKLLHKCLPNAGTGFLYKMLRKKNITLNDKKAEGKELLQVGDVIKFYFSQETYDKFSAKASSVAFSTSEYIRAFETLKGIKVLFENEHILILDKPVGILTQKAKPDDLSLNEWMIGYLFSTGHMTEETFLTFHPSVTNRLDRNTSGIVLCGKSLAGSQLLSRLVKERQIQKLYHTICVGYIDKASTLTGYIRKDAQANKVEVSIQEAPLAKQKEFDAIKTAYRPLCANERFTYLEVDLITGKTHQIRAHLASIGHSLIGDVKYGDPQNNHFFREQFGLKHQLLHARSVEFPPLEEECFADISGMRIEAPLPVAFQQIREHLFLR